jgi:purine-nucleoside phosphorylase
MTSISTSSHSTAQEAIAESVQYIQKQTDHVPRLAIVLGTGMGRLADDVRAATVIEYENIPHFPHSTVESHAGRLLIGNFHGVPTVMMQGRVHFYEGYSMQQIAHPVRVMRALGAETIVVMNAAGSVNPLIPTGSLVLVQDHINLMGNNPLIGPNDNEIGPRFPDMSEPYSRHLIALAEEVALDQQIPQVYRGTLIGVTGPNLETAAEYRMFQLIGADVVTMSTIPEVITAVHCGLRVCCISVVTDECLPDKLEPVSLNKIFAVIEGTEPKLMNLVQGLVKKAYT